MEIVKEFSELEDPESDRKIPLMPGTHADHHLQNTSSMPVAARDASVRLHSRSTGWNTTGRWAWNVLPLAAFHQPVGHRQCVRCPDVWKRFRGSSFFRLHLESTAHRSFYERAGKVKD
ncbi:MAG: hypothetical protein ACLTDV_06030 [Eubacterium sp.]